MGYFTHSPDFEFRVTSRSRENFSCPISLVEIMEKNILHVSIAESVSLTKKSLCILSKDLKSTLIAVTDFMAKNRVVIIRIYLKNSTVAKTS